MIRRINKAFLFFLNLLFTKKCLLCQKFEDTYLCQNCFRSLTFKSQSCPNCGLKNKKGEFCQNCKKYFSYQGIMIAGDFNDKKLSKLIKLFKYKFIKEVGLFLGLFLFNFFENTAWVNPILENKNDSDFNKDNSLIIAAPLSRKRERWRGFNQSQVLAEIISKKSKIPIFNGLKKKKDTKIQSKLKKTERKNNLKDCFEIVNKNESLKIIQGKKIIIIDDVATSGATIEEISKELKKYQPQEIWGLVLAHG